MCVSLILFFHQPQLPHFVTQDSVSFGLSKEWQREIEQELDAQRVLTKESTAGSLRLTQTHKLQVATCKFELTACILPAAVTGLMEDIFVLSFHSDRLNRW